MPLRLQSEFEKQRHEAPLLFCALIFCLCAISSCFLFLGPSSTSASASSLLSMPRSKDQSIITAGLRCISNFGRLPGACWKLRKSRWKAFFRLFNATKRHDSHDKRNQTEQSLHFLMLFRVLLTYFLKESLAQTMLWQDFVLLRELWHGGVHRNYKWWLQIRG